MNKELKNIATITLEWSNDKKTIRIRGMKDVPVKLKRRMFESLFKELLNASIYMEDDDYEAEVE